ncbi:sphingosine-1-phosphate phosphatase 2 isoform X2 [Podarcis muralis]
MACLLDSQPVARFQRCCGLFPASEGAAEQAGKMGNGSPLHLPAGDVANGRSSPAKQRAHPPAPGAASNGWKDCSQEYVVKNYFYYYLFRISAAMGQEVFYITFLPFSYWSINPYVARRLILMWSYPLELGLLGAFLFSTLVCLSRIYTGMHTVLDVIVGSLISAILTALAYPTWDLLDHLMLTSPWCPMFCIVVPLILCYNYPKLDYYSPTRADTTTILGAGAGAITGFWINNHYVSNVSAEEATHSIPSVTGEMLLMVLAQFLVGIAVLLIIRQIIKSLALKSLCSWYKVSINDIEAMQQIEIEVPYKFITYSTIGLSATVLVPLLHKLLGLN